MSVAEGTKATKIKSSEEPALVSLASRIDELRSVPGQQGLEAARLRLFDTACCIAAGLCTSEIDALGWLFDRQTSNDRNEGELITLLVAATRATELDDIHIRSCTTVGSVVVPTALVVARSLPTPPSCSELLGAIMAGYEAMIRVGLATEGATSIYRGIWPTYLSAPFGAVTTTGVLLDLSATQLAHALAIAASRSVGMAGDTGGGTTSRWYTLGRAAAEGYYAAIAAGRHMDGDLRLMEGMFGPGTGVTVDLEQLTAERNGCLINDVDTKPFRVQRQSLSAVEAFRSVVGHRSVEDCAAIEVFAPEQYRRNIDRPGPPHGRLTPGVQYLLGLAAFDGGRLWDSRRHPVVDNQSLRDFMDRITVNAEEELTVAFPEQWGGRVRVTWRDGSVDQVTVLDPHGSARLPYDVDAVERKYQRVFAASGLVARLGDAGAAEWISDARRLAMSATDDDDVAGDLFALFHTAGLTVWERTA